MIRLHPQRVKPTHPEARDASGMSNLIGIAYPDEATATEVARTLSELQKEHSIELDDLVVAVRQDNGKIKLRQSFSPGAAAPRAARCGAG